MVNFERVDYTSQWKDFRMIKGRTCFLLLELGDSF
jgi:hypothetical protein